MFSFRLRHLFYFFLLLCFFYPALSQADEKTLFDDAYAAYQKRDEKTLNFATDALVTSNSILAPYAEYWRLLLNLETADSNTIQAFLARYPDTPFADKLRAEWLKILGKREKWNLFLAEYPKLNNEDATIACFAALARYSEQQDNALEDAKPLWFTSADQPSSCDALFSTMRQQKVLTIDDAWARLRLAFQANQVPVAKTTARYLAAYPDLNRLKVFDRVADKTQSNPQKALDKKSISLKTRLGRELGLYALERVARSNPEIAVGLWEKIASNFNKEEKTYFWGRMALQASRNHLPDALEWYKKADGTPLDNEQQAWKARAALRSGDWDALIATINAMPQIMQNDPTWRYWQARALKAKNNITAANAILAPLSKEPHYYGLLAEEELGEFVSTPVSSYRANETDIAAIEKLPGVQRAIALDKHNLRTESRKEWQWAIRNLDDTHLIAAAELAIRQDWIDLAINTADKTQIRHDFALRYPTPYRDKMQSYAKDNQLDEAWVYGLIRQESRFINYARSGVGAAGLMQIMPATARWIAKRLGITDNCHCDMMRQSDTNIQFGTYYLRHVLDVSGNQPVMATAAYNAGPGRAKRWAGTTAMEAAVYIETIPFGETRDYVKKVMANTQFYSQRLGQAKQPLKQRLGTINAVDTDTLDSTTDPDI